MTSHGIGLIANYLRNLGNGKAAANEKGHVVSEAGSMIVYDGARGWGQIVAREATLLGMPRPGKPASPSSPCATPIISAGRHLWRDVRGGGLVSISFVNITDQRPASRRGAASDARFGTNPVTVAIPGPTPDRPIIADMATSRIAMGKVRGRPQQGRADRRRHSARRRRASRPPTRASCTAGRAVLS